MKSVRSPSRGSVSSGAGVRLGTKGAGYPTRVSTTATKAKTDQPFLTDVETLRKNARAQIEDGAITKTYAGDTAVAIDLLQGALATEIVCVLRYTMHAVAATGIASEGPKKEFLEHAAEEQGHMMLLAERINQLGGNPDFDPGSLVSRSASQYGPGELNLVEMLKENLIAERIAIDHYRELVNYFGAKDSTTRIDARGRSSPSKRNTRTICTICSSLTKASPSSKK